MSRSKLQYTVYARKDAVLKTLNPMEALEKFNLYNSCDIPCRVTLRAFGKTKRVTAQFLTKVAYGYTV